MSIEELEKSGTVIEEGGKILINNGEANYILKKDSSLFISIKQNDEKTKKIYKNQFDMFNELNLFEDNALIIKFD